MVLVEYLPQNQHKQHRWESNGMFPSQARWRRSAEGVCSVFQRFGCTCSPKVHRLGNPRRKMLCLQLFPRPPVLLYPTGMCLPQQHPDEESVFDMAVDSILCLGMQAKAFYRSEELTQSQERLWKLPQQVRHWTRCVATLFPGRGCALSFVWGLVTVSPRKDPDPCGFLWEVTWAASSENSPLGSDLHIVQMFWKFSFQPNLCVVFPRWTEGIFTIL